MVTTELLGQSGKKTLLEGLPAFIQSWSKLCLLLEAKSVKGYFIVKKKPRSLGLSPFHPLGLSFLAPGGGKMRDSNEVV